MTEDYWKRRMTYDDVPFVVTKVVETKPPVQVKYSEKTENNVIAPFNQMEEIIKDLPQETIDILFSVFHNLLTHSNFQKVNSIRTESEKFRGYIANNEMALCLLNTVGFFETPNGKYYKLNNMIHKDNTEILRREFFKYVSDDLKNVIKLTEKKVRKVKYED